MKQTIDTDKLIEAIGKELMRDINSESDFERGEASALKIVTRLILSLSSSTEEKEYSFDDVVRICHQWNSHIVQNEDDSGSLKAITAFIKKSSPPLAEKKEEVKYTVGSCICIIPWRQPNDWRCKNCGKIIEIPKSTPQPLTIEQVKDQVAREAGYTTFYEILLKGKLNGLELVDVEHYVNEAMDLYISKFSNEVENLKVENGKLKQTIKILQPRRLVDED